MTKSFDKVMNLMFAEGIVLAILGICAILLPKVVSITTSAILSIILIVFGVYRFVNSLILRKEMKNPYFAMIIGLLMAILGCYLFLHPIFNLLILTISIALYFLLESINTTIFTLDARGSVRYWWLGFFMALLQFILGLFILVSLPFSALWVLGTLLGISLLFSGMSLITMFISTKMIESQS